MTSLFIVENKLYVPTEHAASPWGPITLHGGASAGLMVGIMEEQFSGQTMQLARLTVDLFRPVPMAPLEARSRVIRDGKRIKLLEVSLFHKGREICRSNGLVLAKNDITLPEHARLPGQLPAEILKAFEQTGIIGISEINKAENIAFPPGLHNLIPIKPVSLNMGSGRGTAWVRLPLNVLDGVPNSSLVSVATLADFSNGFAQLHLSPQQGFINADITLNLHRLPEDDWVCIDARTLAQANGMAMVEAVLYDQKGMIGRVSQSNLAMGTYSA